MIKRSFTVKLFIILIMPTCGEDAAPGGDAGTPSESVNLEPEESVMPKTCDDIELESGIPACGFWIDAEKVDACDHPSNKDRAIVSGLPGSTLPYISVVVINLDRNYYGGIFSDVDGSFGYDFLGRPGDRLRVYPYRHSDRCRGDEICELVLKCDWNQDAKK